MSEKNKLKVALIEPPIKGHLFRGIGFYAKNLFIELQKIKEIQVSLIKFNQDIYKFDLIHYPYFDPFFLTLPLYKRKPTIVTVHDLIPLAYPKFFPKGVRGFVKWNIQKISLFSCRKIITDSNSSRSEIIKYTGLAKEKLKVIYLAAGNEFKKIKSVAVLKKIKEKLNLPDEFILHVGDVNYNKNIEGLIKAFHKLQKRFTKLSLVLVGSGFTEKSSALEEIKKLTLLLHLDKKIIYLSKLDTNYLVGVYNLAKVYIQPSFAEGFGLPILEAMSCECPVVISNAASLVEISARACFVTEPTNTDKMADDIALVLQDAKIRKYYIEKGKQRAKYFSWKKTALQTANVYQSAIYKK